MKYAFVSEVPEDEKFELDKLIKDFRRKYIRPSTAIVSSIIHENEQYLDNNKISASIYDLRELAWREYLNDEVQFNIALMKALQATLETPKGILNSLITEYDVDVDKSALLKKTKEICGEYAARVFPYIYQISLSTTNSRRSRAGKTFEAIIYQIYDSLDYRYDSQSKIGRKTFTELGLGKKVDSILPSADCYTKRRNKTIIGTMKTSLRERWQEVAEEIERTKIPEIHLLTVDENIAKTKAQEMANHNIIVVAYDWVANSEDLKQMKNIISFEEYMYEEIPAILEFWVGEEI